jgi:hypothetical protein
MHYTCQAIVGVEGGQQPDLVVLPDQLLSESFNMTPNPARIRVRVGRDKRYAHGPIVAPAAAGERPASE